MVSLLLMLLILKVKAALFHLVILYSYSKLSITGNSKLNASESSVNKAS